MSGVSLRDLAGALEVAAAHNESYGREAATAGREADAHDAAIVCGVLSGLAFACREAARRTTAGGEER